MKLLAVIGKNRELGRKNDLLWHLPTDLAHYKKHTIGKTVIMGQNTLLSMPHSKPLPGRNTLVLAADWPDTDETLDGGYVYVTRNTLESFRKYLFESGLADEAVVSGGAAIYRLFLDDCDELVLTEVDANAEDADVYFPEFADRFSLKSEDGPYYDGELKYYIRTYAKNV